MISVLRQVYPATICRIIIRAIIPLQTTHTLKNTYAVKCLRDGGDWQLGSGQLGFLLGQSRDGDMNHKNNKINKRRENTQMLFVEMKCDWLRNGIRGAARVCCFFNSYLIVASALRPMSFWSCLQCRGGMHYCLISGDQDITWLIIGGLIILQVHVLFSF